METFKAEIQSREPDFQYYDELLDVKESFYRDLAGPDVYWDGWVEDAPTAKDPDGMWYRKMRKNKSKTKWGTLRVFNFPFMAIFRYDDCDDHVIFSMNPVINNVRRSVESGLQQMELLLQVNQSVEVGNGRKRRNQLRSIDGDDVYLTVKYPRPTRIKGTFRLECPWNLADVWENKRTNEVICLTPGFNFSVEVTINSNLENECVNFFSMLCCKKRQVVADENLQLDREKKVRRQADGREITIKYLTLHTMGMPDTHIDFNSTCVSELTNDKTVNPAICSYVEDLYASFRRVTYDEMLWKEKTLSYEFWVS